MIFQHVNFTNNSIYIVWSQVRTTLSILRFEIILFVNMMFAYLDNINKMCTYHEFDFGIEKCDRVI